jgi:hypothetical protein
MLLSHNADGREDKKLTRTKTISEIEINPHSTAIDQGLVMLPGEWLLVIPHSKRLLPLRQSLFVVFWVTTAFYLCTCPEDGSNTFLQNSNNCLLHFTVS